MRGLGCGDRFVDVNRQQCGARGDLTTDAYLRTRVVQRYRPLGKFSGAGVKWKHASRRDLDDLHSIANNAKLDVV